MNNLWSNAGNWVGGVAPAKGEANVILQFNTGSNPSNFNNIPSLTVQEIDFFGKNTLAGFAITLAGNTKVTQFSSGNGNTINLELDLTGTALAHDHVFTVFGVANFMTVGSFITNSGPNTLDKEGPGDLDLSNGNNTYSGSTLINQGTLLLLADNAVPKTSAVTVNAGAAFDLFGFNDTIGSLAGAGTVGGPNFPELTTGGDNTSTTFSGVISGNTALIKNGTGTLTLAGLNTLSTFVVIDSGTLQRGRPNAIPSTCHVDLPLPGAKFDVNNFADSIGELNGVPNTSVTLGNTGFLFIGGLNLTSNFEGTISGGGSLGIASGTVTLGGPNTYQGATTINGGTLKLGANNAIPSQSRVIVNAGGTLDCNNFRATIGSLEGVGNVKIESGSLTTGGNNRSTDFAGIVSGTGQLDKEGSGTMSLHGFNTNPLTTVVTAGTLLVSNQPKNDVFVIGGTLGGRGPVGVINVTSAKNATTGGTLSPGDSSGVSMDSTGGLTFSATPSTFHVAPNGGQFNTSGQADLISQPTLDVSAGFATQLQGTFTIINAAGGVFGLFKAPDGTLLPDGKGFTVAGVRLEINYTPLSVSLTRVPGPATQYLVSAPSSSQAGTPFDVTVTALDPNSNIVNTYAGTVHFTTSDPSGGTVPADYTFTQADQGVHTFAAGATLFTAGDQTITVTDAITGVSTSATVTVTPAPAVTFTIAAPASSPSGSPFDITVTAQDPYGNTDTNYQGTVTFSSSDTDPGVVLPADYTFQAIDSGSVTFAGGGTLITPGDQTLAATDTVGGITGSAVDTVAPGPEAPPGNRPGGLGADLPLVVRAVPGAAAPAAGTIGSPLPGTEKTLPAPLDAEAVDGFFASTQQDAHSLAGLRTNHNALSWANDGFWDGVSDEVPAVV